MKTKTIESLQQRLKAKGFNPGPIDGIDGPWTFGAWSAPSALDLPLRLSLTKKPVARKGSAQTTMDL
jgi:hypothetical protein